MRKGPGTVPQEMLERLEIARHVAVEKRDPDTRVDGKPTVLPGEHGGGGVRIEKPLLLEPADHAAADPFGEHGEVALGERSGGQERRWPVGAVRSRQEDAVGDGLVQMGVAVEPGAEAVEEGDGADSRAGGWRREVVKEFRDAGVSGTKDLDNRLGLAAVLARVESNGVKIVLVENATRLARDLMVGEVILQQLTSAGCKVIATDSGTDLPADSDDLTRRLIRQVLGAAAEFDRRVTVMKLRAARERRGARRERCEGRKPFDTLPGESEPPLRIRERRRKPPPGAPAVPSARL